MSSIAWPNRNVFKYSEAKGAVGVWCCAVRSIQRAGNLRTPGNDQKRRFPKGRVDFPCLKIVETIEEFQHIPSLEVALVNGYVRGAPELELGNT